MIKQVFFGEDAISINEARIKHLDSLNLNLKTKKILETGCGGKGDITKYLLNQTQDITLNDCRIDNIKNLLENINKNLKYNTWDLNNDLPSDEIFDIIICYGTLYHLTKPDIAIKNLSKICKDYLIISTCVNGNDDNQINIVDEGNFPTQGKDGYGCRPGRQFVYSNLQKHFNYVYTLKTQPNHKDYPLEFPSNNEVNRCIFIGSHNKIDNELFLPILNMKYKNF